LHCGCGTVNKEKPRQIRMPNGPGREADELQNIVCQICRKPFTLSEEGALNPPGWQGRQG
jgi:hypothetical protein